MVGTAPFKKNAWASQCEVCFQGTSKGCVHVSCWLGDRQPLILCLSFYLCPCALQLLARAPSVANMPNTLSLSEEVWPDRERGVGVETETERKKDRQTDTHTHTHTHSLSLSLSLSLCMARAQDIHELQRHYVSSEQLKQEEFAWVPHALKHSDSKHRSVSCVSVSGV